MTGLRDPSEQQCCAGSGREIIIEKDAFADDFQCCGVMPGKSQKPKRPTVVAPIPITGTIWHFSDLHFDPHSYPGAPYYGVDHNNLGDFAVHAWEPLLALITEEGPADFLVFSGDFVDAPKLKPRPSRKPVKREPPLPAGETAVSATEITETQAELRRQVFRYSADFILALAEAHGFEGLLRERVIVCPGNHDVDWERALTDHKLSLLDFSDAFNLNPAM